MMIDILRSNSPAAAKDQELIEERRMEARNMLQVSIN